MGKKSAAAKKASEKRERELSAQRDERSEGISPPILDLNKSPGTNHPANGDPPPYVEVEICNVRRQIVTGIENARLHNFRGTYGICENCGEDIPEARLKAVPGATKCVGCKTLAEEEAAGKT